ncbi:MAG: glutamyl-tRNA amidotransferase [Nitrospirae bacterium RBG_16_43_11]|nr:MAG: glutamyl-tRNA amidotransferase [Nitrospirae bacterium RBG_16_43_11]
MTLLDRFSEDLKESLKSRNSIKTSVIRLLKSSIKYREIEKKAPLSDDEIIEVIMSGIKQRRESVEQFSKGGRTDLVQKESNEIEIMQAYLPQPLTEEELVNEVKSVIKEVGATSAKDMGKVMKALMPRIKGRAEGTKVSSIVKELMEAQAN